MRRGLVDDAIERHRERQTEIRHRAQLQQMGNTHHQEMVDLIGQYNELREKYDRTSG